MALLVLYSEEKCNDSALFSVTSRAESFLLFFRGEGVEVVEGGGQISSFAVLIFSSIIASCDEDATRIVKVLLLYQYNSFSYLSADCLFRHVYPYSPSCVQPSRTDVSLPGYTRIIWTLCRLTINTH